MESGFFLAIAAVIFGGAMEGSFALPMKFMRGWAWENIWFVYSAVGLLVIPWLSAGVSVPQLAAVYGACDWTTLLASLLFGLGWGIANVLFGLAVPLVGMAMSFAVVVGMSAALGSLIPLIVVAPGRIGSTSGAVILLGVALTLAGVAALGAAGRIRERARSKAAASSGAFRSGLILCVMAGFLAPMLNFSFAFGSQILTEGARRGATPENAVSAIWAIALTGGFLTNGGFAALKLWQNCTWSNFGLPRTQAYWLAAGLMGILWVGGLMLYGRGAAALGELGPAVGWPLFQASMILFSSGLGAASGEWKGAGNRFVRANLVALATLVIAIAVLSVGNWL